MGTANARRHTPRVVYQTEDFEVVFYPRGDSSYPNTGMFMLYRRSPDGSGFFERSGSPRVLKQCARELQAFGYPKATSYAESCSDAFYERLTKHFLARIIADVRLVLHRPLCLVNE